MRKLGQSKDLLNMNMILMWSGHFAMNSNLIRILTFFSAECLSFVEHTQLATNTTQSNGSTKANSIYTSTQEISLCGIELRH